MGVVAIVTTSAAAAVMAVVTTADVVVMDVWGRAQVHLFDIDIPGGQRFKESDTLSPGQLLHGTKGSHFFFLTGEKRVIYSFPASQHACLLSLHARFAQVSPRPTQN